MDIVKENEDRWKYIKKFTVKLGDKGFKKSNFILC